jgi:hypothetical protein
LWDNISCSKPLSVKSMSGSECSLLWDKSTVCRPDTDLNSSVGMLISWLCERNNTCKQVRIQLPCILCTEWLKQRTKVAEWILIKCRIKCGTGDVQKRQMDKSALVCSSLQLETLYYVKVKLNFLKMVLII